ncbi:MAG: transketolase [Propionibacteriaceae bacterium]|nr:transketolase [Propionibacteriaceae bacterium]
MTEAAAAAGWKEPAAAAADVAALAKLIRYLTLKTLRTTGYGHVGGSLSVADALAALYGAVMAYRPEEPDWPGRDFLVLSKGHAGPALYAALAAKGVLPVEALGTLNANGGGLPSHPDRRQVRGVEMTTGSMGQGVSVAAGLAYGLRARGRPNRVYAIVGDGELNEGQCWEAAQFAAHHRLDNLVVMVDDNKRQLDGWTKDICEPFDFVDKFRAFGLAAERVPGNDPNQVRDALFRAQAVQSRPTCLVLDTVKGAGVPYFAALAANHHVRLDAAGEAAVDEAIAVLAGELGDMGVEHA